MPTLKGEAERRVTTAEGEVATEVVGRVADVRRLRVL
jgi:hypothetical protein